MFRDLPAAVVARMRELEETDAADRLDGSPYVRRLRQVTPDTARLLTILAASAPAGDWVEIGTSAGYSALWLSQACRAVGRRLVTIEIDERKLEQARETFEQTGVGDLVELVAGDAHDWLRRARPASLAFVFMDHDKDLYEECLDLVVLALMPGGLLVADNVLSHEESLAGFSARALADERLDTVLVPLERGVLIGRKTGGRHDA